MKPPRKKREIKRCRWCGRGPILCPMQNHCLSQHEQAALCEYISKEGTQWKAKLRAEWTAGSATLRQVRNIIGPSGLSKMHPPLTPESDQ